MALLWLWLCFAYAGESRVWEIHVYLHNVQPPPSFFFLGLVMPSSRRPRRLTGGSTGGFSAVKYLGAPEH